MRRHRRIPGRHSSGHAAVAPAQRRGEAAERWHRPEQVFTNNSGTQSVSTRLEPSAGRAPPNARAAASGSIAAERFPGGHSPRPVHRGSLAGTPRPPGSAWPRSVAMGIQARGSGRLSPQRQRHSPANHSLSSHQGLTKLLSDNAPGCLKEVKFESYFGRKVAIDASMHIYQFMARCRAPHSPWRSARLTATCGRPPGCCGPTRRRAADQRGGRSDEVSHTASWQEGAVTAQSILCTPTHASSLRQPPAGHAEPHRAVHGGGYPAHVRASRRL